MFNLSRIVAVIVGVGVLSTASAQAQFPGVHGQHHQLPGFANPFQRQPTVSGFLQLQVGRLPANQLGFPELQLPPANFGTLGGFDMFSNPALALRNSLQQQRQKCHPREYVVLTRTCPRTPWQVYAVSPTLNTARILERNLQAQGLQVDIITHE